MGATPLINSPPKQKTPPKRTLPLRSRRIAAQKMDHIPASKRGEVLLKKKLGLLEPSAPSSSAPKRSSKSSRTTSRLQRLRPSMSCSQLAEGCACSQVDPCESQCCRNQNVAPSRFRSGRERPLLYFM
jgi:hypothetical protein